MNKAEHDLTLILLSFKVNNTVHAEPIKYFQKETDTTRLALWEKHTLCLQCREWKLKGRRSSYKVVVVPT